MRPIIVLVLAALLFLGLFVIGQYREDQEFLRQHLEQRDARNREFNRRMDELEERREGGNL
jgi:Tfp pilus assembly protein PilN